MEIGLVKMTDTAKKYRDAMSALCCENSWVNHAWGALVGVWCGDAAGALLEGFGPGASDRALDDCLAMVGGGPHNVDPGAITDDGELTAALLRAIASYDGLWYNFPLDEVAAAYRNWYASCPFDIGYTCRGAFSHKTMPGVAANGEYMIAHAASLERNKSSQANGALMRIMPVAVWCASIARSEGLKPEAVRAYIREYAAADARLSHPNPVCADANILYCIAAAHLINNPGDGLGALAQVEAELEGGHYSDDVIGWYRTSGALAADNFCENGGHVKHAFRAAFYHLRRRSTYEECLRDVLRRGGDTDTNAAIAGGLIGALHGYAWIPDSIKTRVLLYDCTGSLNNHKRPETYSVFRSWPYFLNLVPQEVAKTKPATREVRVEKLGQTEQSQQNNPIVNSREGLDSVVSAIIGKFEERARFGKAKYGTDLDRTDLGVLDWIQHAQEEHMDAILYLEKLKRVVGGQ